MEDLVALAQRKAPTRWVGHPLVLKESTESTNDDARAAAIAGAPHGYFVVADSQSAGRGRRGRTWHSPAGRNVYCSLVVRSSLPPDVASVMTLAAGLAVAEAVSQFVDPDRVAIKWPNDVRIDAKKIAGVLVEGAVRGGSLAYAIVGIGINVNGETLPVEIAELATTIQRANGRFLSRDALVNELMVQLERRLDALVSRRFEETIDAVSVRCDTLGKRVNIDDISGIAMRIAPDGALVIQDDMGVERMVRSGEVQLVNSI